MTERPEPKERAKPINGRCPECRMLVLTGEKSGKTYKHGRYDPKLGRVDLCPGSGALSV